MLKKDRYASGEHGSGAAWLDCSGLGKSDLNDLIVNRAKLWLDAGHIFGGNAGQFQRVVLACPRATLQQALCQLKSAVEILQAERGSVIGNKI